MAAPYAATLLVMLFPLTTHTVLYAAFYFCLLIMVLGGFLAALFSPEAVIATQIEPTPNEISSTS
jgi:hypothetical protein